MEGAAKEKGPAQRARRNSDAMVLVRTASSVSAASAAKETYPCGLSKTTYGYVVGTGGTLLASPDALFIRLSSGGMVTFGGWQGVFWRFFLVGIVMYVGLFIANMGGVRDLRKLLTDKAIMLGSVLVVINNICYMRGMQVAPAANTMVIFACCPMISTFFVRTVTREPLACRVMLAAVVSFLSVLVVVVGELQTMNIAGALYAIVAAVSMSAFAVVCFVETQRVPNKTMLPCLAVGGVLTGVVIAVHTGGDISVSRHEFFWLFMQGAISAPLWQGTLAVATQYILPMETNMIMLLETFLGPFWVWGGGFESPPQASLVGGAGLIACLVTHGYLSIKAEYAAQREQARLEGMKNPLLA